MNTNSLSSSPNMSGYATGRALSILLIAGTVIGIGAMARRWFGSRPGTPTSSSLRGDDLTNPLIEAGEASLDELRSIIASKGKVELHCHLNGSVRRSTLDELSPPGPDDGDGVVHTIEDAFALFRKVYTVVNSEEVLRRVVRELLEDCVADDVRYLELRTTPRKVDNVASRREYVRIVIDEISKFESINDARPLLSFPRGKIAVRLILTVDRSQSVAIADQTVDLALRFSETVVGIDFAGNPTVGSFADFKQVFTRARGHGLFTTVHTSEIRGVENETDAILDFKPNRMGHFLFPTEEQIRKAIVAGIVVESCPTSNICALSGRSPLDGDMNNHSILERFIKDPTGFLSINTDDPGAFSVKLSDELFSVARTFKLNREEIERMIVTPARHAFLSKSERDALEHAIAQV